MSSVTNDLGEEILPAYKGKFFPINSFLLPARKIAN